MNKMSSKSKREKAEWAQDNFHTREFQDLIGG